MNLRFKISSLKINDIKNHRPWHTFFTYILTKIMRDDRRRKNLCGVTAKLCGLRFSESKVRIKRKPLQQPETVFRSTTLQ